MACDVYGREIRYLRLSVTDACNIRCHYCMPATDPVRQKLQDYLHFEEITRLVSLLSQEGIETVRITGGEPLLRRELSRLVAALSKLPQINEVLLTTNGILLERDAAALRAAGLRRINIHLDTLKAELFRNITRGGDIERVFAGIEAAQAVGFDPIKLNVVLQKGLNDTEAEDLIIFGGLH